MDDLIHEWQAAQCDWPQTLYRGSVPANLKDCEIWLAKTKELLGPVSRPHLTPAQLDFIENFQRRVWIYRGDLKADPFQCTLGECG